MPPRHCFYCDFDALLAAMSVSMTSTFLFEASHSRCRDMEPFHPNRSMKPTAPWQGNFSELATDPARAS